MASKLITPRKLQGFVELDPVRQIQFNEMQDKIKKVFERHCFVPLDTPILEYSDVLLAKSGGDIDKEIYRFTKGDTDMCMRYDLTVPLARYVAMNFNTMSFPFKRYQIGKVFRGERPQKGRFREFCQCDADIIGLDELPLLADAECISLYKDCYKALDLDVQIFVSDRNLINGLLEDIGVKDNDEVLTLIDKLDKIGKDNVKSGLIEIGLKDKDAEKILMFAENKGNLNKILSKIEKLSNNEKYQMGIKNLKEVDSYLKAYGMTDEDYGYNCSIIRGHNYYTGTVFECFLTKLPELGAVGGGGRFDNLAGYYTDKKLPGVGMSIGLTRLFDILTSNNLLPEKDLLNEVYIIPMGEETITTCIRVAKEMRDNNIKVEIAIDNKSFKSKMKEANKKEVPYVIIIGEDEIKTNKYSFKDMKSGEQEQLALKDIINKVKKI